MLFIKRMLKRITCVKKGIRFRDILVLLVSVLVLWGCIINEIV